MKFERAVAEIEGTLSIYGINENDARTYLGLVLEIPNISEASRRCGVERNQFYRSREKLVKRKLAHVDGNDAYSQVPLLTALKNIREDENAKRKERNKKIYDLKKAFGKAELRTLKPKSRMHGALKRGLAELLKPYFSGLCIESNPGLAAGIYLELFAEYLVIGRTAEHLGANRMRAYRTLKLLKDLGFVNLEKRGALNRTKYHPVPLPKALEKLKELEAIDHKLVMDNLSHLKEVLGKEKVGFD